MLILYNTQNIAKLWFKEQKTDLKKQGMQRIYKTVKILM